MMRPAVWYEKLALATFALIVALIVTNEEIMAVFHMSVAFACVILAGVFLLCRIEILEWKDIFRRGPNVCES